MHTHTHAPTKLEKREYDNFENRKLSITDSTCLNDWNPSEFKV